MSCLTQQERREKNKEAAKRCRERKKQAFANYKKDIFLCKEIAAEISITNKTQNETWSDSESGQLSMSGRDLTKISLICKMLVFRIFFDDLEEVESNHLDQLNTVSNLFDLKLFLEEIQALSFFKKLRET